MGRPKVHVSSAELDAQIARIQAERDAEIARLLERRQEAERAEHHRRGELLAEYLDGPEGASIRRALAPAVAPRDRALFALDGAE